MASVKFVCPACHTEHSLPVLPGMEGGRWINMQCPETRENMNVRIVAQAKLAPSFDYKDLVDAMDAECKADAKWREQERIKVRGEEYQDIFKEEGEKKDERQ
jgi:hypothetical protein